MRRILVVLLALALALVQAVLLVQPAHAVTPVPTITSPAANSTTADTTPTITGTSVSGAAISINLDGTLYEYIDYADSNGDWDWTPSTLAAGEHTLSANAYDSAGDGVESAFTTPITFTIGDPAPPGPAAPLLFDPADGALVGAQVTASGVIADGGTVPTSVRVFVDGSYVGDANLDGVDWRLALPRLSSGSHTVYAVARDADGNDSDASATSTITVDATAPAVPVITFPTDGFYDNENVTFRGTGEPGARLTIIYEFGTFALTVPSSGEWEQEAQPLELGEGTHTFSVRQSDGAGNESPTSDPVTYTFDATAPEAPVIGFPDSEANPWTETDLVIGGTGEVGTTVSVLVDGVEVGTDVVDSNGEWRVTGVPARPSGSRVITAYLTDRADNESAVSTAVTVDVELAPPAPVITKPTDGNLTNGGTESIREIAGTAEADSIVRIFRDGVQIAEVTAGTDGVWGYVPPAPFPDGSYELTATATNEYGTSPVSDAVTQTYDTVAPAAPLIATPVENAYVRSVVFTGTTEPGARVVFTFNGQVVEGPRTTADSSGNWTLTLPGVPDGTYALGVLAADPAGNPSPSSAPRTFTVDTGAPAAPQVDSPVDGDQVGDEVTVSGTGEPNATVTVRVDGTVVGTALVDSAGNWQLVTDQLDEGDATLSVTQADRAGNASSAVEVDLVVDTEALPPLVTAPADGAVIAPTDAVTFSGTAEPGASVTIRFDDGDPDTTDLEITVEADEDGDWEWTPGEPLPEGAYTVTAVQTDEAGNASEPSAGRSFVVDATAPAAPVVTLPAPGAEVDPTVRVEGTGEPGATVTVRVGSTVVGTALVDGNGNWSLTTDGLSEGDVVLEVVQTDPAGNLSAAVTLAVTVDDTDPAAPVVLTPVEGENLRTSTITVTGTGEPGATVTVRRGDTTLGTAVVNPDGTWQVVTTRALPEGASRLSVSQRDPAGNGSEVVRVNVVVDTGVPAVPTLDAPLDGTVIAPNEAVTFSGTAEPDARVILRFDDGDATTPDLEITVQVDGNGVWEWTPGEPLPEGAYTLTVRQSDEAGNTSAPSTGRSFVVDGTAPAAPVVTSPESGDAVEPTPTLVGTGEPGATVTVRRGTTVVGTALVDGDGTWSLTTEVLGDGDLVLEIVQTDPAGNVSPALSLSLSVDTTAPPAPVVEAATQTGAGAVTVTGTGEPGATITVYVDGAARSPGVTVGTDGTWSLDLTGLDRGTSTITATATDAVGNVSDESAGLDVVVVAQPVIARPDDGSATTDRTPELAGTGEPGAVVTVRVATSDDLRLVLVRPAVAAAAEPGDVLASTTVGQDGTWSVTPAENLDFGLYAVVAEQAGDVTLVSEVVTFAVVEPPVVTSPAEGADVGRSFEVCGTGEPGLDVDIVDGAGKVYGSGQVDDDGTWCVRVSVTEPGSYALFARQGLDGDFELLSGVLSLTVTADAGDGGDGGNGGGGGGNGEDDTPVSVGSGSNGGSPLASTGGPTVVAGLAGLLLAVMGALLLQASRRQRLTGRRR